MIDGRNFMSSHATSLGAYIPSQILKAVGIKQKFCTGSLPYSLTDQFFGCITKKKKKAKVKSGEPAMKAQQLQHLL